MESTQINISINCKSTVASLVGQVFNGITLSTQKLIVEIAVNELKRKIESEVNRETNPQN